jgi:hypothetical protein
MVVCSSGCLTSGTSVSNTTTTTTLLCYGIATVCTLVNTACTTVCVQSWYLLSASAGTSV